MAGYWTPMLAGYSKPIDSLALRRGNAADLVALVLQHHLQRYRNQRIIFNDQDSGHSVLLEVVLAHD
jgi:hypothetical protein